MVSHFVTQGGVWMEGQINVHLCDVIFEGPLNIFLQGRSNSWRMDPRKWSCDSSFQNSAKRSGRKIPKRDWLHVQKLIAFCSTKLIEFDQILNELWWWSRIVVPQKDQEECKRKSKQDLNNGHPNSRQLRVRYSITRLTRFKAQKWFYSNGLNPHNCSLFRSRLI